MERFVCFLLGHNIEGFDKEETYLGYSGLTVTGNVAYKRCKRCNSIWKEVWCGFSEIYWEKVK